jgi:hypothetical protein
MLFHIQYDENVSSFKNLQSSLQNVPDIFTTVCTSIYMYIQKGGPRKETERPWGINKNWKRN